MIERLTVPAGDSDLRALAALLVDAVESGAAASFLAPLTLERAEDWWRRTIPASGRGAIFLVTRDPAGIAGTVQLHPARRFPARGRRARGRSVMERQVALLRGINVGKAKRISMADLRKIFEGLGYADVRTLLNSGNVVYTVARKSTADDGARIEKAIVDRLGITTRVVVLTGKEMEEAVRENPLGPVADDPSRLLFMALRDSKTAARLKPLLDERWTPEALALRKRVAYLWCANGIRDSRLWAAASRVAGDAGTARNLATMTKLLALVREA